MMPRSIGQGWVCCQGKKAYRTLGAWHVGRRWRDRPAAGSRVPFGFSLRDDGGRSDARPVFGVGALRVRVSGVSVLRKAANVPERPTFFRHRASATARVLLRCATGHQGERSDGPTPNPGVVETGQLGLFDGMPAATKFFTSNIKYIQVVRWSFLAERRWVGKFKRGGGPSFLCAPWSFLSWFDVLCSVLPKKRSGFACGGVFHRFARPTTGGIDLHIGLCE